MYNYHVVHVELVQDCGMNKALVSRRTMVIWMSRMNPLVTMTLIKGALD
jgi:hypothetical protein